jgi:hypothetical protein
MYAIHRVVKRTQLYLDEDMARLLAAESRRRHTTVSSLVREAITQHYGHQQTVDRTAIIERLAGVWADRDELEETDTLVRRERRSQRPKRWEAGAHGEVPPRQRRRH